MTKIRGKTCRMADVGTGSLEPGSNSYLTPAQGATACLGTFTLFDLFDLEGFDPGWRDDFNNRAFFLANQSAPYWRVY